MTIVLVTEEHCDDLTEKYFMSLEGAIEEWDPYYDGELSRDLEDYHSVEFELKYRNVGIYKVTPENVQDLISPWFYPYWSWDTCDYISDYRAGIDTWEYKIAKRAMEADTSYLLSLGHTLEEIEEANQTVPEAWRMERKILLYKTAWDPRYTSVMIYPELEALGVPLNCYHPDYNPYRGCGRGTF